MPRNRAAHNILRSSAADSAVLDGLAQMRDDDRHDALQQRGPMWNETWCASEGQRGRAMVGLASRSQALLARP